MMIAIAGGVLAALGVLSAGLMVAAAMGWIAAAPGLTLWILFPIFTLMGWGLLAAAGRDPTARVSTKLLAAPLLVMALVAAVGLVGRSAGLLTASGSGGSAALWYVLVLAGLTGLLGSAVSARPRA